MPKFVWNYFFAYSTLYGMIEARRFGLVWGRVFLGLHIIPKGKQAAKLELPTCCIPPKPLLAAKRETVFSEVPNSDNVIQLSAHVCKTKE